MIAISEAATPAAGASAVQVWTLVVAGLAVLATIVAALLLRRTGKGTVDAAAKAAAASERSAQAAEASAAAAQEAVGVNRETASSVAARAEADALAKRYQDAAEQLGHEKPAVRLAGVYAMAKLADDWLDQRQACVDVLCAYLRMAHSLPSFQVAQGEKEICDTIMRLIVSRVGGSFGPNRNIWTICQFDFSGVTFADIEWRGLRFEGHVSMQRARFEGKCVIQNCSFEMWGLSADYSIIDGDVRLSAIAAMECGVSMQSALVKPGASLLIERDTIDHDARWTLDGTVVIGLLKIRLSSNTHSGAFLLRDLVVAPNGAVEVTSGGDDLSASDVEKYGRPSIDMSRASLNNHAQVRIDQQIMEVFEAKWTPREQSPLASVTVVPFREEYDDGGQD